MNKKSKRIIVIAGPTAVGKTALSVNLAKHFNTSVISADSRQFYKELNIGTAKPTIEEMGGIPHFMVDNLSIHAEYNVGKFEKDALSVLNILFETVDTVIVSGGSGLYIKALCEGIHEMPAIPLLIRNNLNKQFESEGIESLQNQLKTIDPHYYNMVDKNNPQRLIRALELFNATGKTMTYYRKSSLKVNRYFDIIKIGLERPRSELYQRIDKRMDSMIAEGLFQEAESLIPFRHLNALQTVGYSEIFSFFYGAYDKEEAIRLLKRNSRRYAKRQLTWFKKDENYTWFHPKDESSIIDFINYS